MTPDPTYTTGLMYGIRWHQAKMFGGFAIDQ